MAQSKRHLLSFSRGFYHGFHILEMIAPKWKSCEIALVKISANALFYAMSISNNRKRQLAEELFLNSDYTQKEISDILDIAEKTFTEWKQKYSWKELKDAQISTPSKVIPMLYEQIASLSLEGGKNADKIVKLATSVEKLRARKLDLATYIEVFKELTNYAMKEDHQFAKYLTSIQQKFIHERINGKA